MRALQGGGGPASGGREDAKASKEDSERTAADRRTGEPRSRCSCSQEGAPRGRGEDEEPALGFRSVGSVASAGAALWVGAEGQVGQTGEVGTGSRAGGSRQCQRVQQLETDTQWP